MIVVNDGGNDPLITIAIPELDPLAETGPLLLSCFSVSIFHLVAPR